TVQNPKLLLMSLIRVLSSPLESPRFRFATLLHPLYARILCCSITKLLLVEGENCNLQKGRVLHRTSTSNQCTCENQCTQNDYDARFQKKYLRLLIWNNRYEFRHGFREKYAHSMPQCGVEPAIFELVPIFR